MIGRSTAELIANAMPMISTLDCRQHELFGPLCSMWLLLLYYWIAILKLQDSLIVLKPESAV